MAGCGAGDVRVPPGTASIPAAERAVDVAWIGWRTVAQGPLSAKSTWELATAKNEGGRSCYRVQVLESHVPRSDADAHAVALAGCNRAMFEDIAQLNAKTAPKAACVVINGASWNVDWVTDAHAACRTQG